MYNIQKYNVIARYVGETGHSISWETAKYLETSVTNGPEVRMTECCGKNLKKKLQLYRTSSPIEHTRAMPCSKSRRPCPFRDVWLNSFNSFNEMYRRKIFEFFHNREKCVHIIASQ